MGSMVEKINRSRKLEQSAYTLKCEWGDYSKWSTCKELLTMTKHVRGVDWFWEQEESTLAAEKMLNHLKDYNRRLKVNCSMKAKVFSEHIDDG